MIYCRKGRETRHEHGRHLGRWSPCHNTERNSVQKWSAWCPLSNPSPIVGHMAQARRISHLSRSFDLATILRVCASTMPELADRSFGLGQVAELCRRRAASRAGRDWQHTRDQILMIGIAWDLASDNIDAQSDACLDQLVQFLR